MTCLLPKSLLLVAVAVLFMWVITGRGAEANSGLELPGASDPYPFMSRNQPIDEVLKYYGKNIDVKIDVDKEVSGTVLDEGEESENKSRLSYLEDLASKHDFVWFYDGVVLHVMPIASIQTEAISLKNNDGADIMRLLDELGILQSKFTHHIDRKNSVFVVTGPAKYTDLVKQVIGSIEEGKRKKLSVLRGDTSVDLPAPDIAPPLADTGTADTSVLGQ